MRVMRERQGDDSIEVSANKVKLCVVQFAYNAAFDLPGSTLYDCAMCTAFGHNHLRHHGGQLLAGI